MKRILILLFGIYILSLAAAPSYAQDAADFAQLQKNTETNIENLKNQGISFYKEGKYIEALNCFDRIDNHFLNTEILILKANCYDSVNNSKKSSEFLIKAIESDPKNSFPYYNLGVLHFKNKNINGAIDNFKKAINYNKNFLAAYYNLGVCYYMKHDFVKAKDAFISALKLDPYNKDVCYKIVLTYNALKDKKMTEKYLDIYSKMSEKNKDTQFKKVNTPNDTKKLKILPPSSNKEKPISDKKTDFFWRNLKFFSSKN